MGGHTMEDRSITPETDQNIEKYMALIKTFDPELYLIKIALIESKVNPSILPLIVRHITNISHGTGFGQVKISISARKVAQIAGTESELVDEDAILYP